MRKLPVVAGIVVVAVAAGIGGYVYLQHEAQAALDGSVARLRAGLGPDGALTYGAVRFDPLRRGAVLSDVDAKSHGSTVHADRLTLRGLSGNQAGHVEADKVSLAAVDGSFQLVADHMDADDVVMPQEPGADPAATLLSMQAKHVGAHAVRLTSPREQPNVTSTFDDVGLSGYGPQRRSTIEYTNLVNSRPGDPTIDQATLAHFKLDGVNLVDTLAALRVHATPPVPSVPSSLELSGFTAGRQSAKLAQFDRLRSNTTARPDGVEHTDAELAGFQYTPPGTDEQGLLKQLGYDGLKLQAKLAADYDVGKATLAVAPLSIDAPGMGSLTLSTTLGSVSFASWSGLANGSLASFDLTYVDASLTDRAVGVAARRDGLSVADEKAKLTDRDQQQLVGAPPEVVALNQAVTNFLNKPGTLEITAKPAQPVSFRTLGLAGMVSPLSLVKELNLQATAR